MTGQPLRFSCVDVFAHEPSSENPLALVVDAQDLSQETTFLLPPVHVIT